MSRKLTRIAVLGVLLCSVVGFGMRGVPIAHASPVSPQGLPAQVSGGTATFTVPCHIHANRVDTCTITHTWQTVTTVNTRLGSGTISTGPDLPCCPGGGSCTTGSQSDTNAFTLNQFGETFWTVRMRWNFDWNNCLSGTGALSITTTFFDYTCIGSTSPVSHCNAPSNTDVSLFACPGTSCNGLAHADFTGFYGGGGGWSALLRTTGDLQGTTTHNNTINP